jgi:hypothetical protein
MVATTMIMKHNQEVKRPELATYSRLRKELPIHKEAIKYPIPSFGVEEVIAGACLGSEERNEYPLLRLCIFHMGL